MSLQHGVNSVLLVTHAADSGVDNFNEVPHECIGNCLCLRFYLVLCLFNVLCPKLIQPRDIFFGSVLVRNIACMTGIITEHRFQHIIRGILKLLVYLLNCLLNTNFRIILLFFIQLIRSCLFFRMKHCLSLIGILQFFLIDLSGLQPFFLLLYRLHVGLLFTLEISQILLCLFSFF